MTPARPPGDPLAQLLQGRWIDPDSGRATGVAIAAIAIENHLRGREAECVAALGFGRRLAVVSDVTTHRPGARLERAPAPLARIDSVVLLLHVHADMAAVATVRAATAESRRVDRGRFGHDQRPGQVHGGDRR
jgi:glycerol-1-phosphate dehydrogenase [NAD(P)+]